VLAIIDYGMGNFGSIESMLRYLGAKSTIVSDPQELEEASAIILPGVGSFDNGANKLESFRPILSKRTIDDEIPFLGVCLGMQLLFESSEEGDAKGLGWIKGRVKKFDFSGMPDNEQLVVPHMGWNEVKITRENALFDSNISKNRFYFVHSYHVDGVNKEDIISTCHYGYNFGCAVQRDNIYGVQFHPEKSHKFGKQIFKNFIKMI
jgi:imidazole glycerol-phosphate synthase subunit HisH